MFCTYSNSLSSYFYSWAFHFPACLYNPCPWFHWSVFFLLSIYFWHMLFMLSRFLIRHVFDSSSRSVISVPTEVPQVLKTSISSSDYYLVEGCTVSSSFCSSPIFLSTFPAETPASPPKSFKLRGRSSEFEKHSGFLLQAAEQFVWYYKLV